MSKRSLFDKLNDALEARVFKRGAAEANQQLEVLASIGEQLNSRASEEFKKNLKEKVIGKGTDMSTATATAGKGVREGYHTITPYIIVSDAPAVVEYVKQTFGGEELSRSFGSAGGYHIDVEVRDSKLMIGGGGEGSSWKGATMPTSLHVYVPDVDEVYRRALAAGGKSLYAPMDHPYGDRDCGVEDAGGNEWFIATNIGGNNDALLRMITPGFRPKDATRFLEFLERGFGAKAEFMHKDDSGVIRHGKVRIGDSIVELSEAHGQWQPIPTALYLYVDDADAWIDRAVAAGAKVIYPLAEHAYGDRSGGVQDEWGNHWYIGTYLGK